MSSSSSAKSGSVISISTLPLPLSCTVNTESVPIIENVESVFDKNNRFRVKISLLSLAQPGTTLQLDVGLINAPSLEKITINTLEIDDVEDKDMMTFENIDISDPPQQQSKRRLHNKSKRVRIKKKKSRTKFDGVIVEGVPSLWFESEINVVSILDDMKQNSIYVNCMSKHNRFVVDCQLDFLFTNHLWIRFKEKYGSSLSDCMVRKETEIGARSAKYFRQCTDN